MNVLYCTVLYCTVHDDDDDRHHHRHMARIRILNQNLRVRVDRRALDHTPGRRKKEISLACAKLMLNMLNIGY